MSSVQSQQEGNVLVNRVSEIPLVKAFCQTVTSVYENTKQSNRLIGATLEKAESVAKVANDQAEPLKKILDRPLSTVSRIADQQLEELQRRYPVINTTPEELKEYGQNLYERSGVKRRVEGVSAAKERGVAKINNASNRVIESARNGQSALSRYITGALNITENIVDKYIASPDSKKRPSTSTPKGSYIDDVKRITNKVTNGALYRVNLSYSTAKNYAARGIDSANRVVKNTTSSISASIQKAITDANNIRAAVLNEIVNRSRTISAKSESAAVYLTKTLSNSLADISDRVISSTSPYLPEGMEKPAASLVSFTHHWQERVQHANTAGDIWKVAVDETKQNLRLARELVQSILNNNELHVAKNKRW